MLFGLMPWDAATLAGAAILLGIVTLGSSLLPALKAANVDPIACIRVE